jgi:hypothetical protein
MKFFYLSVINVAFLWHKLYNDDFIVFFFLKNNDDFTATLLVVLDLNCLQKRWIKLSGIEQ